MVLNWSCERSVCSSSRPARHVEHLERADGEDRPAARRSRRRGCRAAGAAARSRRAGRPSRRTPRSRARRGRSGGGSRCSRPGSPPTGPASPRRGWPAPASRRCRPRSAGAPTAGSSGPREACTADIESSTVTRCARPPVRSFSLRPSAGQDQRLAAVHDVRAVELGGDVHGERGVAHRVLGDLGVGGRGDEVAAHREEHPGLAVAQRPDGVDGVEAVLARRVEAELVAERVEEVVGHPLPDAHGAVALDVGVAAHRAQPGARLADVALQQGDVDDLLDRGHRVVVLGDAHRPAGDRRRGVARTSGPPR